MGQGQSLFRSADVGMKECGSGGVSTSKVRAGGMPLSRENLPASSHGAATQTSLRCGCEVLALCRVPALPLLEQPPSSRGASGFGVKSSNIRKKDGKYRTY